MAKLVTRIAFPLGNRRSDILIPNQKSPGGGGCIVSAGFMAQLIMALRIFFPMAILAGGIGPQKFSADGGQ